MQEIYNIKAVIDVIDNAVIKRPTTFLSTTKGRRRTQYHHLCLDRAYKSRLIEQKIIKRGYVPYIHYKRKSGQ